MKTKKKVKKEPATRKDGNKRWKWKNIFYVQCYIMASQGMTLNRMAQMLGTEINGLKNHMNKKPSLRKAIEMGREVFGKGELVKEEAGQFQNFVFKRLPENLRDLWNKIRACEEEPNGVKRMEALLQTNGKYARMHLFIYAMNCMNFSVARACRAVNVPRSTVNFWIETEPGFADLLQQMHEAKKDFFQEHLVRLVKKGDTAATIFANKTFNRDLGFGETTTVEHTGKVDHVHHTVDLDQLDLPTEVLAVVLEAYRKFKRQKEVKAIDYRLNGAQNSVSDEELLKETIGKEEVIEAQYEKVED